MLLRASILLLVVMNLGVAVWWALHTPPVPAPVEVGQPGIQPLVLLSETEAAPPAPPTAAELDAEPEPLSANPRCLSLGPFQTPADLRRVMNALTPVVGRIQFRETRATELRGYRVFLPAFASREEALTVARTLAGRGIDDYYVVTAGEQENTVSLGLFRDLANAEKRRDEVRALGIEPQLEPRTEQVPNWWVDIAVPEAFAWRQHLGGYVGVEAHDIACF